MGTFTTLVFGKPHLQHFSAAELFPLQASPCPEALQQPLPRGNNLVQAQFEKLQPSLHLCPFSWDSVTRHVRHPVPTQSQGKHFCLNHLQLFKATLLWVVLEEPRLLWFPFWAEQQLPAVAVICPNVYFHMISLFQKGMRILPQL